MLVQLLLNKRKAIMETRWNEATHNRPEGSRPIDGNYVFADIDQNIQQLKNEDAWQKNDRNGITIFKSESLTLVVTVLKENAEIPLQTTDGFVTVQTLNGLVNVITNNLTEQIGVRQLITLHPKVEYSIIAAKESAVLITVVKHVQ